MPTSRRTRISSAISTSSSTRKWRRLRRHHGGGLRLLLRRHTVLRQLQGEDGLHRQPLLKAAISPHPEITINKKIYALPGNALDSKYATKYNSPVKNGCTKNYIIYISNGPNQENSSADTLSNQMPAAAGGSTTPDRTPDRRLSLTRVTNGRASCNTSPLGIVTYNDRRQSQQERPGPGLDRAL